MRIYILAQVDVLLCDALPKPHHMWKSKGPLGSCCMHTFHTYSHHTPYFLRGENPPGCHTVKSISWVVFSQGDLDFLFRVSFEGD